jgi:hypothetical protein
VSDLAKWKVQGPVKSVKTSHATRDPANESWTESGPVQCAWFRPDGKLSKTEGRNPDGSVYFCEWVYDETGRLTSLSSGMRGGAIGETRYLYDEQGRHVKTVVIAGDGSASDSELYSYDDAGRTTKTRYLRNPGSNVHYSIKGTSIAVGCAGATAVSTTYDHHNLPSEVCFLDVDDKPIQRVMLLRDEAGRLLNQAITMIGPSPWPGMQLAGHGEEAEAAIRQIFADAFTSTSYTYDDRGRLIEGEHRIGTLGGDRTTFRYEDREEAVEETTEHTARQASLNEDGTLRYSPKTAHVQHNRFDYVYDSHGNWTSRTVSIRLEPETAFRLSNIEQREIEYYAT